MSNRCYKIISCGPIRLKSFEGETYPERTIRLQVYGRWGYDSMVGTACLKDALIDLHEGDVVAADVSFHACKIKGHWQQRVFFSNFERLKMGKNG